ncbi:hypothetical protein [Cupriavidus sp. amp6]|uniref:hypothetical protein n=1 Tax=Cupriavidus sp. amp6 TaxID=388051 RepID=UPI0004136482|nr:hypothetical protein [Cupriavidus sp. amp6]
MLRAMAVLGGACLLSRAHAGTNIDGFREIPWSALLPEGWDPKAPFRGLRLESLDDADPRAQEALMNAREYWKNAPVEPSLNGA